METNSPLLPGPDLLGGLFHSRESGFIAGARVGGQSGNEKSRPCITMGIQGHTQAHVDPAREERSTRRWTSIFTPEQNRIPTTGPQGGLYARFPLHQVRALQSSPSPARLLSLPTGLVPQVPGSLQEMSRMVAGAKTSGGDAARLPGEPLLEAHRACGRWSSHSAPGADGAPGEKRGGRSLTALRYAAVRGGAGRGAQALLPRGRLCGEWSSTDCRRRTSRSSQSVSGSRPLRTARRSCRLFAEGNSR